MGNNFLKMLNDIDEKNKAIINKNKSKNKFDIKSCSTQDLKALKKLINAELRRRRILTFNAFWQKHKKSILAILTLLVSFIGSIIIPLLFSK